MDSKRTKPAGSMRTGRLPAIKNNKWNTQFSEKYKEHRPEVKYFNDGDYMVMIGYSNKMKKYVGLSIDCRGEKARYIGIGSNSDKNKLKEIADLVMLKLINQQANDPQSD